MVYHNGDSYVVVQSASFPLCRKGSAWEMKREASCVFNQYRAAPTHARKKKGSVQGAVAEGNMWSWHDGGGSDKALLLRLSG